MTYYAVSVHVNNAERDVYDGTDYSAAERLALQAYRKYYGRAYVTILLDGGTWMSVSHIPGDLSTSQLCEPASCLHPRCGEINPLYCYCVERMDAETRERYRTEYA